jgi:hypothetical protein
MNTARTSGDRTENRRSESDLDRRYGRIAISALVAALPYGCETKKPTAESAESREDHAV